MVDHQEPLDFMIQAISLEILVEELLNLGAGAGWDTILWNSKFSKPAQAMLFAILQRSIRLCVLIVVVSILFSSRLGQKKYLVNRNS